jgi:hypothetical protein
MEPLSKWLPLLHEMRCHAKEGSQSVTATANGGGGEGQVEMSLHREASGIAALRRSHPAGDFEGIR